MDPESSSDSPIESLGENPVETPRAFKKILIANRGEVALRLVRACADLGIQSVVVHSTEDTHSMPVRLADEALCIGPGPSRQSYLNMAAILTAAQVTAVDAIHPGLGFLSENAEFAETVRETGLTFIGPSPEHIRLMGDKITAKQTAEALGLPVVPGSEGGLETLASARAIASEIGYPVLLKATAGGGGRGMQVAQHEGDLERAYSTASREAKSAFGNDQLYLEKYLAGPRHIEVQVIGDQYGNAVHLGERDCSLQRRHQKILEESPSPALTLEERQSIGEISRQAVAKLGYSSLGTIEYLYEDGKFYFIEMNTRLQVEHPITEAITGIDLVKEQIAVAEGKLLSFGQEDVTLWGHAIECRINAEHPSSFLPSPGKIGEYHAPGGIGVRVDSHAFSGYTIPPTYDSLISKLVVYAGTRQDCLCRLERALTEYVITGVNSSLELHAALISEADIKMGAYDIHWLEKWIKKRAVGENESDQ